MGEELQIDNMERVDLGSGDTPGGGAHPTPQAWTPIDDNGLTDWWNTQAGLGGLAADVTPWTSQGGRESELLGQPVGGDSTTVTLNGAVAIELDAANVEHYLAEDYTLWTGGSGCIVMVVRPGTPDNAQDCIISYNLNSESANDFQLQANAGSGFVGQINMGISGNATASGVDIENVWTLVSLEFSQAENAVKLFYDGTEVATTGYSSQLLLSPFADLRIARDRGDSQLLDLDIYGMSLSKSPGQRETHEGYWAWSAAGNGADKDFVAALPVDHPYKSAAPET